MALARQSPRARGHASLLGDLGLGGGTVRRLAAYLDLLAAWAPHTNLSGARSSVQRVSLLVAEAMAAAPWLEPGALLDVGSGNGSPGLVLAILRPDLPAALLEPRVRRWAFLREACRAAGRTDIAVRRERHDTYQGLPARNVTLRGLRLPLADLAPLVEEGGQVLIRGRCPPELAPFHAEAPTPAGWHRFRREPSVPRET